MKDFFWNLVERVSNEPVLIADFLKTIAGVAILVGFDVDESLQTAIVSALVATSLLAVKVRSLVFGPKTGQLKTEA